MTRALKWLLWMGHVCSGNILRLFDPVVLMEMKSEGLLDTHVPVMRRQRW